MTLTDFYQGDDINLVVVIPDDAGDPQNLNDVYNILVTIYHKKKNTILERFSVLSVSGYSALELYDPENGEVYLKINDEETIDTDIGIYKLVAERIIEDADATDGYDSRKFGSDCFNVIKKEPQA